MRTALGALQWQPDVFWDATLTEFFMAIYGLNDFHNPTPEKKRGPTQSEMTALLARYG